MLALYAAIAVTALFVTIFFRVLSPLVALIVISILTSVIAGFGLETAKFVVQGLSSVAPIAGMFVFAILYFGIIMDAGLLTPIVRRMLIFAHGKPTRITLTTATLALLIHLDGSGAVCFLVTIPAMLPLYEKMRMDKRILACVASLSAGVNFLPWTGPTLRASAALNIPTTEIFRPLIIVEIAGIIFAFAVAYMLGKREERRLASVARDPDGETAVTVELSPEKAALARPNRFWVNAALTAVIVGVMIAGLFDPVVVLMIGTALALVINYPDLQQQRERVDAHAKAALMMTSVLFAAGAFIGIMNGTGMLKALATTVVAAVPPEAAAHIPVGLALIAMPLSLLFDPDSFYFAVLPVIAHSVEALGGEPIHVAQAALLGQMTTGFPVSPLTPSSFLVAGLAGVEFGAHQRFSIPFLWMASIVMTIAAVVLGVLPF